LVVRLYEGTYSKNVKCLNLAIVDNLTAKILGQGTARIVRLIAKQSFGFKHSLNHTELLYSMIKVDARKGVLNFLEAFLVSLVKFELGADLLFVRVAGGALVVEGIVDEVVLAVIDS
jgi:hypothetical protein